MAATRREDEEPGGAGGNAGNRRAHILKLAAQIFARKGYRGTSMRDIGEAAGVLGGSLYHHIRSKDALFVELHDAALDEAEARISAAISAAHDPWARLEAACAALLAIQLDPESSALPIMHGISEVPEPVRAALVARRDRFEDLFRALVAELPLPADIDRSIYRNMLLSQLNAAADWVRPGRLSADEIAAQVARVFRHG